MLLARFVVAGDPVLHDLGIARVALMTNNPLKVEALRQKAMANRDANIQWLRDHGFAD